MTISEKGLGWASLAVGLCLLVVNLWLNRNFLHDDSMISLRYALNFVEFGDLSWNPGDRVEGYTNFLHVVLTSLLIQLGLPPITAAQSLNAAGVVAMIIGVFAIARQILPNRFDLQMLAVAAVAANVSVAVWIFGALEAPLAAAFMGIAIGSLLPAFLGNQEAHWSRAAFAGVFFALAALTRPDGVVTIAVTSVLLLLLANGSFWSRFRTAFIVGGIPFVTLCGHMAWRISYYQDWLPNTFHAKVGLPFAQRVAKVPEYFLDAGLQYVPVLTCALGAALLALLFSRGVRAIVFLLGVIAMHLVYVTWSGGDHMVASRVILPIVAPAAFLLVLSIDRLGPRWTTVGVLGSLAFFAGAAGIARSFSMDWAAFNGSVVGHYIAKEWPEGSVVALNTAGSTPFFARQHEYVDMLGLNDRVIARREDVPRLARRQRMPGHGKGDAEYVLSREPDFIIFGGGEGIDIAEAEKWFLTGVEIQQFPEFAECYVLEERTLSVPDALLGYGRRSDDITFRYYRRTCS